MSGTDRLLVAALAIAVVALAGSVTWAVYEFSQSTP